MADLKINISDNIYINDSFEAKTFIGKSRKFIVHIISGWFPSKRLDLSPKGVQKKRLVDRINNKYVERVVDALSGRIIRDKKEKLTEHHSNH